MDEPFRHGLLEELSLGALGRWAKQKGRSKNRVHQGKPGKDPQEEGVW